MRHIMECVHLNALNMKFPSGFGRRIIFKLVSLDDGQSSGLPSVPVCHCASVRDGLRPDFATCAD